MSSDQKEGNSPSMEGQQAPALNIKVTDDNNELMFKIKKSTKLEKLMEAFCDRHGKAPDSVRFVFEGKRVQGYDTPEKLEMEDGDMLEVFYEQQGGSAFCS